MRHISVLPVLVLALACLACSTANQGSGIVPDHQTVRQFSVQTDPGIGDYTPIITVSETASDASVQIAAQQASGLGAAYVHLAYDTSRYTPEHVEFGGFLGDSSQVLTLALTDIADEVPVGITQIAASGVKPVNGSGVLATVYFRAQPFTKTRAASRAPSSNVNAVSDLAIIGQTALSATLRWTERNIGDYDNNSQVNISDLTPLGVLFGQSVASASDPTWAAMVDGDGNGVINIADITPIGANFGNKIDGYMLYVDSSGNIPYGNGVTAERSAFYSTAKQPVVYEISANVPTGLQMDFSVKPVDASELDNPGPQSNIAQVIIETGPPVAPVNLTAVGNAIVGASNIKLDWVKSTSPDAIVSEIWRKLSSQDDTGWNKVTEVANSIQTYTDSGLTDDSFDYRLCARDFTDEISPWTSVVTATPYIVPPPSAPENVTAVPHPSQGSAIQVTWNAPADDSALGYKVYRKGPGDADFSVVANKNNKFDTQFDDSGLTAGQTYEYYVTSFANPLESAPSPTTSCQPSAEADIQIVSITTDKTTHGKAGGEPASNITVTTDIAADSYEWSASSGSVTGTGATVTWSPSGGATAGSVTVTCIAHNGASSDSDSIKLQVVDEGIKSSLPCGGNFVDFNNLDVLEPLILGGNIISDPKRPFSYYADGQHVVLFNRWETWCGPCVAEMPMLNGFAMSYGPLGFYMVLNNSDDNLTTTKGWMQANDYQYLHNYYGEISVNVWEKYGYDYFIPYNVLIDRDGHVRRVGHAATDWEDIIKQCVGAAPYN